MCQEKQAIVKPQAIMKPNAVSLDMAMNSEQFEMVQRMAKVYASSDMVPDRYRGNLSNCIIAMEMASRIGASCLSVMQETYIVNGTPAFSAKFLIACVNKSGIFTPLGFEYEGNCDSDDFGCRAYATERESGEKKIGPLVTISMAKKEGWYSKRGSKWQTMPELMMTYRAATFWANLYCPQVKFGMTVEEIIDIGTDNAINRITNVDSLIDNLRSSEKDEI